MNKAMKEQTKARNSTASSQGSQNTITSVVSSATTRSTTSSTNSTRSLRRRTPEKELAAAKLMQKHNVEIELRFD